MKFSDFEYKRPDFETVEKQLDELTEKLAKADNKEELLKAFQDSLSQDNYPMHKEFAKRAENFMK